MCSPCLSQGDGLRCSARRGVSRRFPAVLLSGPLLFARRRIERRPARLRHPLPSSARLLRPDNPSQRIQSVWTTRALPILPPPLFFHAISTVHPVCALVRSTGTVSPLDPGFAAWRLVLTKSQSARQRSGALSPLSTLLSHPSSENGDVRCLAPIERTASGPIAWC